MRSIIIVNSQFSTLSSQFSTFNSQLSTLNSQLSTLSIPIAVVGVHQALYEDTPQMASTFEVDVCVVAVSHTLVNEGLHTFASAHSLEEVKEADAMI